MAAKADPELIERARKVIDAETDMFTDLFRISRLHPQKHLRYADWSGVDFSGCDLRGFDFTGARLLGCNFSEALIEAACFDQAEIDHVSRYPAKGTNLRSATDWDKYLRYWPNKYPRYSKLHSPVITSSSLQSKDRDSSQSSWHDETQSRSSDKHLPIGAVFQDAPLAPEMVIIPSGKFLMGSPEDEPQRWDDEGPQHEVTIGSSFAIGRYAVTFDEWDFAQSDKDWWAITRLKPRKPYDGGWGRGNRPVINVSWDDAQAYTKWLSAKTRCEYRLPTEAEWEYAARAGTQTPFWWGTSITTDHANYEGSSIYEGGGRKGEYRRQILPVDSFEPNPFGLYQVHGNVWEWCADYRRNYEAVPVTDPTDSPKSQRALRGGSWSSGARIVRAASRIGSRIAIVGGNRNNSFGFRCARVGK